VVTTRGVIAYTSTPTLELSSSVLTTRGNLSRPGSLPRRQRTIKSNPPREGEFSAMAIATKPLASECCAGRPGRATGNQTACDL